MSRDCRFLLFWHHSYKVTLIYIFIQQNWHISLIKRKKMMGHWLKSDYFSQNNGSLAVLLYVESVIWMDRVTTPSSKFLTFVRCIITGIKPFGSWFICTCTIPLVHTLRSRNLFSMLFAQQMRSWGLWGKKRPHSAVKAEHNGFLSTSRLLWSEWISSSIRIR